jgi:hypothetical protein
VRAALVPGARCLGLYLALWAWCSLTIPGSRQVLAIELCVAGQALLTARDARASMKLSGRAS